jgi:hypothetical protein
MSTETQTVTVSGAPLPTTPVASRIPWRNSFFVWGAGSYLVVVGVLVGDIWRSTRHHMIYVLDDAAIHMVMARNLAFHMTWGIVPGHYESASSSPVWTTSLAVMSRIIPGGYTWFPLILGCAASLGSIYLLAVNQSVLVPSLRRPLDAVLIVLVVNLVLYLPALTVIGLEHTLQVLLALAIALQTRTCSQSNARRSLIVLFALIVVGELVRFEMLFLVVGLAAGLIVLGLLTRQQSDDRKTSTRTWQLGAGMVGAAFLPIVAYGVVNRLFGGGWLPNSLLAKSNILRAGPLSSLGHAWAAYFHDKGLVFASVVLIICVILAWRRRSPSIVIAIGATVALVLQAVFAQLGSLDRYQAYIIALTVLAVLQLSSEWAWNRTWTAPRWSLAILAVCLLVFGVNYQRAQLTAKAPIGAKDVFEQKYLAGEVLEKYYPGAPIASGELGWISWLHRGPFTDLLGLGDYSVLQEMRKTNNLLPPSYLTSLMRSRDVEVIAMYPQTTAGQTPTSWIFVGDWTLHRKTLTAFNRHFQFWATKPSAVDSLIRSLKEFRRNLPPDESLNISPFARLRANH